jgi:hypothetical protein
MGTLGHSLLVRDQRGVTAEEAGAINDRMVREMELRRRAQPERRQVRVSSLPPAKERRRICAFCHQNGDHQTPTQCLRALER